MQTVQQLTVETYFLMKEQKNEQRLKYCCW